MSVVSCPLPLVGADNNRPLTVSRLSALKDKLHLDCGVERERVDADRSADVFSGVAQKLDQELTGPVGNLGLLGEARVGTHECADPRDAGDLVDRAFDRFYRGQGVNYALAGGEL